MKESHQVNFISQLKNFKEKIDGLKAAEKNRLVLIIMANTHDPALCTGCVKDADAVKNTFKTICLNTDYNFCCIEISGKNYSRKNLLIAIDSMGLYNDVTVFYLLRARL
jgi:siroheme synthase (precorrin-2 oxidase/ferrochelatase)